MANFRFVVVQGMSNWHARKAALERGCTARQGKGDEWIFSHPLLDRRVTTKSTRAVASRALVVFLKRVDEALGRPEAA